jgi:predicted enzyme related to lactoylglutathione lyase
MGCKLTEILVDCRDPRRLAQFWSDVLGWPLTEDDDGDCWLSSTGEQVAPEPRLMFLTVAEPKTIKNRIHLDVNPSGCDQEEELERLLGLGARPVDIGQGNVSWVVLADPEGNEFCLLRRRVDA